MLSTNTISQNRTDFLLSLVTFEQIPHHLIPPIPKLALFQTVHQYFHKLDTYILNILVSGSLLLLINFGLDFIKDDDQLFGNPLFLLFGVFLTQELL